MTEEPIVFNNGITYLVSFHDNIDIGRIYSLLIMYKGVSYTVWMETSSIARC